MQIYFWLEVIYVFNPVLMKESNNCGLVCAFQKEQQDSAPASLPAEDSIPEKKSAMI